MSSSEHPQHLSWQYRSTRAHRLSYTVERVVLWGGTGAIVALIAALAKMWWWS